MNIIKKIVEISLVISFITTLVTYNGYSVKCYGELGISNCIGCSLITNLGVSRIEQGEKTTHKEEIYSLKFWLSKLSDAKKILMTNEEIEQFSKKTLTTSETNCVNLDEFSAMLSKDELYELVTATNIPNGKRFIGSSELNEEYYKNLLKNRNELGILEKNEVKYGFITKNTQLRTYPTSDVSYDEPNDIAFDQNCETGLKVWERVLILHMSLDGKYYFVQTYNYNGWVKIQDVAIATKEEWNKYSNPEEYLIVTGNIISLDVNIYNEYVSQLRLTMGTKLPLVKNKPKFVDKVSTNSSYVILLPNRKDDGSLQICNARIPYNRDVHVGYLPYTQKNILKQMFKLLGDLYGWSDLWESRDCSSLVVDVYKTFGFDMPRNVKHQVAIKTSVDVAKLNLQEKKDFIMNQNIGALLYMPNHVMLYIGNFDDEPYVIHAIYVVYSLEKEKKYINCIDICKLSDFYRANGLGYIESINYINNLMVNGR